MKFNTDTNMVHISIFLFNMTYTKATSAFNTVQYFNILGPWSCPATLTTGVASSVPVLQVAPQYSSAPASWLRSAYLYSTTERNQKIKPMQNYP